LDSGPPLLCCSAAKETVIGVIELVSGVFIIGVPAFLQADRLEARSRRPVDRPHE
jgi:hypothetical protein